MQFTLELPFNCGSLLSIAGDDMPNASNYPRIWEKAGVRVRRLRNDGFGWFLLSVLLFTLAMISLRVYYVRERALELAMQTEILATVGTREEPSQNTSELGLIAA